ncbi:MAG: hypothetical protein ABEJ58_08590 [Halodesulfurarchaeum sp.]
MLPDDNKTMAAWDGTNTCPFCGTTIDDPGVGFIEHTRVSPYCKGAFDVWRERVAEDISGEWLA